MTFIPKNWQDLPARDTPITAASLEDMEGRLAGYTDQQTGGLVGARPLDPSNAGRPDVIDLPLPGGAGLRDIVSVADAPWNADRTGFSDPSGAINAAMVAVSAAGGGRVVVPYGTYACATGLIAQNNVELFLDKGASVVKTYVSSPGAITNPLIQQANYVADGSGLVNFVLAGRGTLGHAGDYTKSGDIIRLYGNNLRINDVTIDSYGGDDGAGHAGGGAMRIGGNKVRVNHVRAINPYWNTGIPGIRVMGGSDVIAIGCHIESGDDALQFVPDESATSPFFDISIRDSAYIGCTGFSTMARFMIAAVVDQSQDFGLQGSITNCSFIGCHGAATAMRLVVLNGSSSGAVSGVDFTNCSVDSSTLLGTIANGGGIAPGVTSVQIDETTRFGNDTKIAPPALPPFPFDTYLAANGGPEVVTMTSRTLVAGNVYNYALQNPTASSHSLGAAAMRRSVSPQLNLPSIQVDGRLAAGTNGSISNVSLNRVRVLNPAWASLEVPFVTPPEVANVSDLTFDVDCGAPLLDPTHEQVKISSCTNVKLTGTFPNQPIPATDVVLAGVGSASASFVKNLTVWGSRFKGLIGGGSATSNGVNLNLVTNGVVSNNVFTSNGASPKAVRVGTSSTGIVIDKNDVSSFNSNPWNLAATATQRDNIGWLSQTLGTSGPAASATSGLPYFPATAGSPTGSPTALTGYVASYYDTTAHKIWIYDGGWKGVVVS